MGNMIKNPNVKLSIAEILKNIKAKKSKKDKVAELKSHASNLVLKKILYLNFSPSVEFDLPTGPIPFQKSGDQFQDLSYSNLYKESRKFYVFIKGKNDFSAMKREELYIKTLEILSVPDAEVLIHLKDKNLGPIYDLSEELVNEAFPGIFTISLERVLQV